MIISVDDYLEAIEPYLPPVLVSPEVFLCIRAIARKLPPMPVIGFEAHLGKDTPQVDLLVCITPSCAGREILAGRNTSVNLPGRMPTHAVWQRIRAFCTQWADPLSPFHQNISNIWLEFDVDDEATEIPIPGVFFGVARTEQRQAIAATALRLLMDGQLPSQVEQNLALCFAALPVGTHIFQIGLMFSRRFDGVRICVNSIHKEHVQEYLTAIGWQGPVDDLKAMLSMVSGFVDTVSLHLDIGRVLPPKIGIECHIDDHPRPKISPRWESFLDHLVACDMCTPDKRDRLLGWPGQNCQQIIWPTIFIRGLNHVKLVCQPGRPLVAKAYFGFIHNWRDDLLTKQKEELLTP